MQDMLLMKEKIKASRFVHGSKQIKLDVVQNLISKSNIKLQDAFHMLL